MEAKGCAKAMVWKDARRRFYWAVRAKIARSAALAQLEEASPESTHDYRVHLLESIAGIEDITDPRIIAEALEKLDLTNTVAQLKADHLARRMLELANEDKKATVDGLVRLIDSLGDEDKVALIAALQNSSRSGESQSGLVDTPEAYISTGPPSYASP